MSQKYDECVHDTPKGVEGVGCDSGKKARRGVLDTIEQTTRHVGPGPLAVKKAVFN